jgi:hypothetical protein
MKKSLAVLASIIVLSGVARADIPPPSPPKFVWVTHKITTEKDYPDYLFFTITGKGKDCVLASVKLDPKTPVVIVGPDSKERFVTFAAVPKDAGKKYVNESEFHAAIKSGKVQGLIRPAYVFDLLEEVIDSDPPCSFTEVHVLHKLDPSDGMKFKSIPDTESSGHSRLRQHDGFMPHGGIWMAGLAGSAALVLAGMWLVGRNRQS